MAKGDFQNFELLKGLVFFFLYRVIVTLCVYCLNKILYNLPKWRKQYSNCWILYGKARESLYLTSPTKLLWCYKESKESSVPRGGFDCSQIRCSYAIWLARENKKWSPCYNIAQRPTVLPSTE